MLIAHVRAREVDMGPSRHHVSPVGPIVKFEPAKATCRLAALIGEPSAFNLLHEPLLRSHELPGALSPC